MFKEQNKKIRLKEKREFRGERDLSNCINIGKKNGMWKGKNVKYDALHDWIKTHKAKSKTCELCGKSKPLDLTNISGEYKRDINDFQWLCRSCHMKSDGRLNNLKQYKNKEESLNDS